MSHSWLQRKRKGELLDLAQKAKLPDADGYLKDDLVELLEEHLNSNETTYAKHPEFRDFYGRSGSPVKRERSSPSEALTVTKSRRRTLVKAPSEEPAPEKSSLITRTPRAVSRRVSQALSEVDIPASPAQLAEVADQSFQVVKTKATELWDRTQIDRIKELVRENASSVAAIQTLILLIEAAGLQWNTLETTAATSLPAEVSRRTGQNFLLVPNFTALLSSQWWAPATLWSLTSWVLPLVFSYFFNLTLGSNTNRKSSSGRQYPADPLTFNIVKAILVYSAFRIPTIPVGAVGDAATAHVVDYSWGPFSAESVGVVRENVPGKYPGLLIGAVVGILVSLYDAALKK
ncbi:Nn.00g028450.m01.CDS01 [Neocucurbitaria sp. VM-36]